MTYPESLPEPLDGSRVSSSEARRTWRDRRDLLAQALDLEWQARAELEAVAQARIFGRELPHGAAARAKDLSARAALFRATEELWGTGDGPETDEPTPVPSSWADVRAKLEETLVEEGHPRERKVP